MLQYKYDFCIRYYILRYPIFLAREAETAWACHHVVQTKRFLFCGTRNYE